MTDREPSWRFAWEPLTPRGIAAFAGAPLGRLLLVQLLVAGLAAASVFCFLERAWFPVVRSAIKALPVEGKISGEELDWSGDSPVELAQNHFLGLAVDLYHSGRLGREAHLQIEFGKEDFRVYSMLGYDVFDYPPGWAVAVNRTELEPWWGAREPFIAVGAVLSTVVCLMILWAALATVYCIPVRVITFLEDRDLNWRQSWRLAGAAMMPGALFLTTGIVGYTFGLIDLLQLGGVAGLQFVIGCIYLFISPFFCPRHPETQKQSANPFGGRRPAPSLNPFAAQRESKPESGAPDHKNPSR